MTQQVPQTDVRSDGLGTRFIELSPVELARRSSKTSRIHQLGKFPHIEMHLEEQDTWAEERPKCADTEHVAHGPLDPAMLK